MALINTLRKKAGKIVVAFVAFSMFAFILTDLFQSNSVLFGNTNEIGTIAGNTITYEKFQAKVDELSYNFTLNTGRNPLSEDLELVRQQAWQQLIVENVFQPEYEQLGIDVPAVELIDMVQGNNIHPQIQQLFTDPNTGVFNRQNVIGFLQNVNNAPAQQRQSWLAFEASLSPSRKLEKYENLLELTKYANKHEAKMEYDKTANASVDYLYVPFFSVNDSTIKISDNDLNNYLSEHENEYMREASKDASYVVFEIKPTSEDSAFVKEEVIALRTSLINAESDSVYASINSDGLTPFGIYKPNNFPTWLDDEDVILEEGFVSEIKLVGNTYSVFKISSISEGDEYFLKASHILFKPNDDTEASKLEAKAQARRILKEIQGGADFVSMAGIYGTDGTASRGGDLGWFGENSSFVQEFKDASFGFKGAGLIPNIVETEFGYHIIKITESKSNKVYKIASIEKELFASDQTLNEIYRQADLFASQTGSITNFKSKADELNLTIRNAEGVQKNDKRLGGLVNARTVVFWLFNNASLGDVSEVFELENQYVVAVLKDEREEGPARLKDVRNEISRKVYDLKKADDIIKNLSSIEGTYDEIKSSYKGEARTGSAQLTLSGNSFPNIGFAPEAIGVAFSLEEGESTLPFKTQNGVIMLTVTSKPVPAELDDYEAYRLVVLNASRSFRRREEPFTFQNIYNALIESSDIEDARYKFY